MQAWLNLTRVLVWGGEPGGWGFMLSGLMVILPLERAPP